MNAPLTIAIPVYNRADIVGKTLDSVAAQNVRPLKVVLVDNNSTDSSLAVLNHWADENRSESLEIIVLQEHTPGAPAARNAALAVIDTEWTMFFDSDDSMPRDHVEKALRTVVQNPHADIVGWGRRIHFLDGTVRRKEFATANPEYENLTQSIFATQTYMARTELFRRAGGWDNTIRVGQDIELGSRLLALKPLLAKSPSQYVDVYDSEVSITNSTSRPMASMKHTLDTIRHTLPGNRQHWVDLQMIIKASSWGRNDPESAAMVDEIIARTAARRRWLWKFFRWYQLHSGRGVARIYALLHLNRMRVR